MSQPPHHNLFDSRGNHVPLGKKVGSGGEGDVYEIAPHRMDVLAKIYSDKIKTWDDAAIKALNPGLTLPSTAIAVIHRSDASGTTWIFANYLTAAAPAS